MVDIDVSSMSTDQASNPESTVMCVHSAFQECSFLLLCSLQSFTGQNLAKGLALARIV